jgi:hypothetical protein
MDYFPCSTECPCESTKHTTGRFKKKKKVKQSKLAKLSFDKNFNAHTHQVDHNFRESLSLQNLLQDSWKKANDTK